MFQISKNNIKIIRGDTGELELSLTLDDEEQTVVAPEAYTAIFSLKKNVDDVAYIFQKELVNGKVSFTHADTNFLPYGMYVYDIQITLLEDNSVHTLGYYTFNVLADITRE